MTQASACIKFCKIGVFRINSQQQRRINTCGMLDAQLFKVCCFGACRQAERVGPERVQPRNAFCQRCFLFICGGPERWINGMQFIHGFLIGIKETENKSFGICGECSTQTPYLFQNGGNR